VVHNTYNETVINNNVTVNKVSYNGGAGGTAAVPTPQERQAAQEPHVAPTPLQRQHVQEAAKNPALFAKANQGKPPIAATPKPGVFNAPGVVGARGASLPPPRPASAAAPPKPAGQPTPGQPGGDRALRPPPAVHPNVPATAKAPTPPPPPPKPKPKPKTPPKENKEGEHKE
jgi:hypothetical protein